jgi:N-methylhydantoinase A
MLVNLVTSVVGRRQSLPVGSLGGGEEGSAELGSRALYSGGAWQEARIFARSRLSRGVKIEGPAIVQQLDATTVIESGATATVDPVGNLRIRVGEAP